MSVCVILPAGTLQLKSYHLRTIHEASIFSKELVFLRHKDIELKSPPQRQYLLKKFKSSELKKIISDGRKAVDQYNPAGQLFYTMLLL